MVGEEQQRILKMVYDGVITAEQAEQLLQACEAPAFKAELPAAAASPPQPSIQPLRWKQYPLMASSLVAAAGAVLLAIGYLQAVWPVRLAGFIVLGFGLVCTLLGVWLLRTTWLRIRIKGGDTGRSGFRLYLPVPLTLAAWGVRIARPFVRQFDMTGVDEVILALRDGTRSGQAIAIDVSGDDDGEQVEVCIG